MSVLEGKRLWALLFALAVMIVFLIMTWSGNEEVTELKGNPAVPERPEDAVRTEKMFERLLEQKDKSGHWPGSSHTD